MRARSRRASVRRSAASPPPARGPDSLTTRCDAGRRRLVDHRALVLDLRRGRCRRPGTCGRCPAAPARASRDRRSRRPPAPRPGRACARPGRGRARTPARRPALGERAHDVRADVAGRPGHQNFHRVPPAGRDVGVETENIGRVVAVLEGDQPGEPVAVRGPHAGDALVGEERRVLAAELYGRRRLPAVAHPGPVPLAVADRPAASRRSAAARSRPRARRRRWRPGRRGSPRRRSPSR